MTRIIKKEVYCSKCKNNVVVPVLTSTSSFALEHDPKLKEKYLKGDLFKLVCPKCGNEIEEKEEQNQ